MFSPTWLVESLLEAVELKQRLTQSKNILKPGSIIHVMKNNSPAPPMNWLFKSAISVAKSSTVAKICLIILPFVILFYYPILTDDFDIWFHLAYGKEHLKNFSWNIDHSQFSWTPALADWQYVSWLGSLFIYLIHLIAGMSGLFILQWTIFLMVFSLYYFFLRALKLRFDITNIMGILLIAVVLKLTIPYLKPELFTILFFTAACFLYFYAKATRKKLFYLYPLLFLIWVNTHGGFIFGIFLLALCVLGETLALFLTPKNRMPSPVYFSLIIATILSGVVLLFNPYGIEYHLTILNNIFSPDYMESTTQLFAYQNMWNYLNFSTPNFNFSNAAWSLLTLGLIFLGYNVYLLVEKKHINIPIIVLNICFFFISMQYGRTTLFYPPVWFFSMNYLLWESNSVDLWKKLFPVTLVVFSIFCYLCPYNIVTMQDQKSWFGKEANNFLPINEVEFVKRNNLPGPIFNDYGIGSYMMWSMYPKYKVWIDSRYGPYAEKIMPEWFNINQNLTPGILSEFTKKYPFKVALIQLRHSNLISWLLNSKEWRIVFFDKVAIVIIHQSVISSLPADALSTNMSPARYQELKNPTILVNLFNIYNSLGSGYGRKILAIYRKNISSNYRYRTMQIDSMSTEIKQKQAEERMLRIPLISATYSTRSRPPIPEDLGQFVGAKRRC